MLESELIAPVESTVRSLASAGRSLRLYPPGSPLPRQAVEAAVASIEGFLAIRPTLVLDVAREGFACRGTELQPSAGADLADMLRSHGVASVVFSPGLSADELLGFLETVLHAPESVRGQGGVARALAGRNVQAIRVVTVSLSVAAEIEPQGAAIDEFFSELAADPEKLATWLAAATGGDVATLAEGLVELADCRGPALREAFFDTLATAFGMQEDTGREALLSIAMDPGDARDVISGMLQRIAPGDIAQSVLASQFGRNMLSLSDALTRLPLDAADKVIAATRAALPSFGHGTKQTELLEHMLTIRAQNAPEPALTGAVPAYRQMVAASAISDDALDASRTEAGDAAAHTTARSVPTMLALLDQQRDFSLYVRTLDSLALLVPRLVREREYDTALRVVQEISDRLDGTTQPWPELSQHVGEALAKATGHATMRPLLDALMTDGDASAAAYAILRLADDAGKTAFVEEALTRRDERAMDVAESLLGRRMLEMLEAAAPNVGAAQLGPLVARLAAHGDPAASRVVEAALHRPDESARVAAVEALGGSPNPAVVRQLAALLAGQAPKVAYASARALSRTRLPGACAALVDRLDSLDVDGRDFLLGREIIGCLSQMPDPAARQALKKLADRKVLIKRGRFLDVQRLAHEALVVQAERWSR